MPHKGGASIARREEHAEDTRRAILVNARVAFAERGYADTSLDDIVAPARLTKGALYHHFKNKAAVFEALYVEMAEELVTNVELALRRAEGTPWDRVLVAVDAFFEASAEPAYVRIVLREAPVVLGHRYRELDEKVGLAFVHEIVRMMLATNILPPLPPDMTSRILLSVVCQVAETIADSEDPERARRDGTEVVVAMLGALRDRAARATGV